MTANVRLHGHNANSADVPGTLWVQAADNSEQYVVIAECTLDSLCMSWVIMMILTNFKAMWTDCNYHCYCLVEVCDDKVLLTVIDAPGQRHFIQHLITLLVPPRLTVLSSLLTTPSVVLKLVSRRVDKRVSTHCLLSHLVSSNIRNIFLNLEFWLPLQSRTVMGSRSIIRNYGGDHIDQAISALKT